MGKRFEYTKEQVLTAIKSSGGIISTVQKKLGCMSWSTANKYINKWNETKKAYEDESEIVLDIAEGVVVKGIQAGDAQLAKWYLSTKGRRRGYDVQAHVVMDNTDPLKIDFGGMTKADVDKSESVEISMNDEAPKEDNDGQ